MNIDIEALKTAAIAATPGPWASGYGDGLTGPRTGLSEFWDAEDLRNIPVSAGKYAIAWVAEMEPSEVETRQLQADADFIAAANPAAVLELIEQIERLTEGLQVKDPELGTIDVRAAYYSLSHRYKSAISKIAELEAAIRKQAAAAKMGMDAAKRGASEMIKHAQDLHGQSNPEALASERAANTMLTEENDRLQAKVDELERHLTTLEYATGVMIPRGQTIPRDRYPGLFTALDEAAKNYTGGDFKLPDLRDHSHKVHGEDQS